MKLATALLRRKELATKVATLSQINHESLFTNVVERVAVTDGIDQVTAKVAKISMEEFTAEFDWYARQLRELDAVIQQTNWTTEVEVADEATMSYSEYKATLKS